MFSKACEYGIRAVIFICSQSNHGKKLGVKDICKEIDAPEFFTAKVLQSLARQQIISSSKGPTGGFYMTPEQEKIPAIDLVIAIDGDKIFKGCALGLKQCSESNPCPIHNQFKSIRDDLNKVLQENTIRDLALEVANGQATLARFA